MERVFITGASSGIGAALATVYAARGAKLGLLARRETELQRLAATLPGESLVLTADVRDGDAMQGAAAHFLQRFGVPDVVIANAGVSHGTATERAEDLAAFAEIMDNQRARYGANLSAFYHRDAGRASRVSGRHCQRRGVSRAAWGERLQRIEGRGDQLLRKSACRIAPQRRCGHNVVPRLYRHADDGAQSLPHAIHAFCGTSGEKNALSY